MRRGESTRHNKVLPTDERSSQRQLLSLALINQRAHTLARSPALLLRSRRLSPGKSLQIISEPTPSFRRQLLADGSPGSLRSSEAMQSDPRGPMESASSGLDWSTVGRLRQDCDRLADRALDELSKLTEPGVSACPRATGKQDLYAALKAHHSSNTTLEAFWQQTMNVPHWVDFEQISRGQEVFYKHALAMIVGFAFQGFIGESVVGPVEVLVRTGGLSPRNLMRRVLSTFQWVLEVTESLQSVQPLGKGHESTVRVRLLHASHRRRLLSMKLDNPKYFDVERYGIPINTYDNILTISFFCCNPIWVQLPQFGIRLSTDEETDFIALYRYLAYLLGTPDSYFATVGTANATMTALFANKGRPTDASRELAENFINSLADHRPIYISRGFLEAGSRYMNGNELCDELKLGQPGLINRACFTSFCWLIWLLSVVHKVSPAVEQWSANVRITSSNLTLYFADCSYSTSGGSFPEW